MGWPVVGWPVVGWPVVGWPVAVASAAAAGVVRPGLLVSERRLGSRLPLFPLLEAALAAPVSSPVRLTCRRLRHRCARLLRTGDGTGAHRQPAIAILRSGPACAVGCADGSGYRDRATEGGAARPLIRCQRRTRAGHPRCGAAGPVRSRR